MDVSGGVSNRQQAEKFFGNDPGDHITQHMDPDMILDAGDFGPQKIEWVQGILHWATGTGSSAGTETTQWRVQDLPMPGARAPSLKKPN